MMTLGKHPGGRPTDYRPEYCQQIIEHFSREPVVTLYKREYYKDGTIKTEIPILTAADFPTLQDYADSLGVVKQTLLNWADKYPEFLDAITRAKEIQEAIWLKNGMSGLYNSQFAQFFGINCLGYKAKQDIALTGADGGPIAIESAEERQARIAELLAKRGE